MRLLRVLQERTYEPLGGLKSEVSDVRVVVATNRYLLELVRKAEFREDLYYASTSYDWNYLRGSQEGGHPLAGRAVHRALQPVAAQSSTWHRGRGGFTPHGPRLAGECPRAGKCHRSSFHTLR
ncbi:sigma-54 factor interaction domain-containing protein [Geomonas sp. RF6]|nr:sigma-54 factor interaction domain-containing protein [Geomonas sp. RF6]